MARLTFASDSLTQSFKTDPEKSTPPCNVFEFLLHLVEEPGSGQQQAEVAEHPFAFSETVEHLLRELGDLRADGLLGVHEDFHARNLLKIKGLQKSHFFSCSCVDGCSDLCHSVGVGQRVDAA